MQSKDQHCYLKIWQKWQFFRFRFTESFGCENNLKIIYFFCTCSYFLWSGLCCSPRRIFTPTKVLRKLACTKFFTTTIVRNWEKYFPLTWYQHYRKNSSSVANMNKSKFTEFEIPSFYKYDIFIEVCFSLTDFIYIETKPHRNMLLL